MVTHSGPWPIGNLCVFLEAVDDEGEDFVPVIITLTKQHGADNVGRSTVDQTEGIHGLA